MESEQTTATVRAYYRAALKALAFVEQRQPTGRRFGPQADARWSAFRGDLDTADRIDLLLRDADAQWPAAFGPRTVFAKHTVAEDDPFGAGWSPLDPVEAEELWRAETKTPPPSSPRATLDAIAAAWELPLTPFDPPPIAPADKLLLAGPSAVAATLLAFHEGADLDWADQVTVLATPPGHRQLAALAGALLLASKPTRLAIAAHPVDLPPGARLVLSDDAAPDDATRARELTSE